MRFKPITPVLDPLRSAAPELWHGVGFASLVDQQYPRDAVSGEWATNSGSPVLGVGPLGVGLNPVDAAHARWTPSARWALDADIDWSVAIMLTATGGYGSVPGVLGARDTSTAGSWTLYRPSADWGFQHHDGTAARTIGFGGSSSWWPQRAMVLTRRVGGAYTLYIDDRKWNATGAFTPVAGDHNLTLGRTAGNLASAVLGHYYGVAIWKGRALTEGEARLITADPFVMWRPRRQQLWSGWEVPAEEEGATLVVADTLHAHTVEAPALSQAHTLALDDAAHGHGTETPTLEQAHLLAPAGALHAHAAEAPTLDVSAAVDPDGAVHAHTAGSVALTQAHGLAVNGALHGHTVQAPTLVQAHGLVVQGATHAHTAGSPATTQNHLLAVNGATHGQTAESVTLLAAGELGAQGSVHAHAAGSPTLVQAHTLAVAGAAHGHTAQGLALSQGHLLAPSGTAHAHTAQAVSVVVDIGLVVGATSHAHTAQAPVLAQQHALGVFGALHGHSADSAAIEQAHLLAIMVAHHAHSVESPAIYDPVDVPSALEIAVEVRHHMSLLAYSSHAMNLEVDVLPRGSN